MEAIAESRSFIMTDEELFGKIQNLIAEKLEKDPSEIKMESTFRGDLGADSLDTYELVYSIEENLGVKIPDEKANEFETVGDAFNFIKSAQAQVGALIRFSNTGIFLRPVFFLFKKNYMIKICSHLEKIFHLKESGI